MENVLLGETGYVFSILFLYLTAECLDLIIYDTHVHAVFMSHVSEPGSVVSGEVRARVRDLFSQPVADRQDALIMDEVSKSMLLVLLRRS